MKYLKPFFALLFIAAAALSSWGQEDNTSSISQIISKILKSSPKIQSLQNSAKAREGAAKQAGSLSNPTIAITVGKDTRLLEIGQEIEYPGKYFSRSNAASYEADAANCELRLAKLELEREAGKLIYAVLLSRKKVELLDENLRLANEFSESASYKFSRGFGNKLDVVKGEAELVRAKRMLSAAQKELNAGLEKLGSMLNLNRGEKPEINGDISLALIKDVPTLEAARESAYKNNPSLQIEEFKLKASEKRLSQVRMSVIPDLSLSYTTGKDMNEQRDEIGAAVCVPLWDMKRGAAREAYYSHAAQENALDSMRREIADNVAAALREYQRSSEDAKLFETALIDEVKNASQAAAGAYKAGNLRFLDLIDAQRTYTEVSLEYLDTLFSLRSAEIELMTAVGQSLTGDNQ